MNEIIVPIDITQEEKSILAVLSIRQFFLIFPTAVIGLIFLFWGSLPFLSGFVDFLTRLIFFFIANAIACGMAFFRLEKHEQFLSEFVLTQIKFRRSQKVYRYM